MKKQYKIALHTEEGIVLFYNEDYNFFTEKFGTIYTNKKKALEKMQYAKKYGTSRNGNFEVMEMTLCKQ